MSEIEKYNPSAIMKNVTDKIKATFAELIPDEEWEKLVQKQVDKFFKDTEDRYNHTTEPSEFTTMAQEILKEMAKDHIKAHIEKTFKQKFDKNNKLIEDAVKDMVVNNASTMFAGLLTQAAQNAVYNMQNQLNNQPRNY